LVKRFIICFWLIAAYAVVFAHSVVPHHHHEQNDHGEADHHHDDEDHHDDDSDNLSHSFELFQHQAQPVISLSPA
jgi:Ca2+/H+ antiporter